MNMLIWAACEQNVNDGKIRFTKSLAKQGDEISKLAFKGRFIEGFRFQ
jgi:hypothetical protein